MKSLVSFSLFLSIVISSFAAAAEKPVLVLFPIQVGETEQDWESHFGSALQEGLQTRFEVFYGPAVEKELEKEYSKIDCSVEQCQQNVAIAFNGELVGDASVIKAGNGYSLKFVINNVITGKIEESKTFPCRDCDVFAVQDAFRSIGLGQSAQATIAAPQPSYTPQPFDQNAVFLFDSTPSGAKVIINGIERGVTPYSGLSHKVGERVSVRLEKQYFQPFVYETTIDKDLVSIMEPFVLQPLASASNQSANNDSSTLANLERNKQQVTKLYQEYLTLSNGYTDLQDKKAMNKALVAKHTLEIAQLRDELRGYEAIPNKTASIYQLLGSVAGKIEAKESEVSALERSASQIEADTLAASTQLSAAEKKYVTANNKLNSMVDDIIAKGTQSEIDEFQITTPVSGEETVTCSRTETPAQCEERGYQAARDKLLASSEYIAEKALITDFKLDQSFVVQESRSVLVDVTESVAGSDYDTEMRSQVLTLSVAGQMGASASDALVAAVRDKIAVVYDPYRFDPAAISEQKPVSIAQDLTPDEPVAEQSNDPETVIQALLTQGLALLESENFTAQGDNAIIVLENMMATDPSSETVKMYASLLDGGVKVKASSLAAAQNATQALALVNTYSAATSKLGLSQSAWIPEFLAKHDTSLPTIAKQESEVIEQQQVEQLSRKEIRALLDTARYLIRRDQYFAPDSKNAYDTVQRVLASDPSNTKAKSYLNKIFEDAADDAVDLAEDRKFEEARELVQSGLAKKAGESRLKEAERKIQELENAPQKKRRVVGGF